MFAFGMQFMRNIFVLMSGNKVLEPHVRGMGGDARRQTRFGLHPIFKITSDNSVTLLIEMISVIAYFFLAYMFDGG